MLQNLYEAEFEAQDRVARIRRDVASARPLVSQRNSGRSSQRNPFQRLMRPASAWWLPAAFGLGTLLGVVLAGG